jgi:hypothetical protein
LFIEDGGVQVHTDEDEGYTYYQLHTRGRGGVHLGFLIGFTTVSIRNVERRDHAQRLVRGQWTQTSPEVAYTIRRALAEKLGGVDEHETRLLPAIISMSEVQTHVLPGEHHRIYALHDENGVPRLAIIRPSFEGLPILTTRYTRGSSGVGYEIPPFDLPDPDTNDEGSSWRAIHNARVSQRIIEALEQRLVQQSADEIAAMAEVDEADAMFDDDEEDDYVNPTEQIAEARQRGMFLGHFAREEYASAYHLSDRGQRHNVPAPVPGLTYYDTTHNILRMFVGDRWVDVSNDELADILAPEAGADIRHSIDATPTREISPVPIRRGPQRPVEVIEQTQAERVIAQMTAPVKPCEEVVLSTETPTRLVGDDNDADS